MARPPLLGLPSTTVLLCGLPILSLGAALGFGFVYDDHWTILGNPALDRPLPTLLRTLGRVPPVPMPDASRPLMVITTWADRRIFGAHAWGFHAVSLSLHVANVFGVHRFARILSRREDVALVTALLFAVLPANAEPVVSINYREDLLATLGVLVAVVGFLSPVARPHGWWRAAGLGAALLAGLLSKESALVAVPLIALLAKPSWAYWRRRERTVTALVAVVGAYALWRLALALGEDGVARADASLGEAMAWMPTYWRWTATRPIWPWQTVPLYPEARMTAGLDVASALLWLAGLTWSVRNRWARGRSVRPRALLPTTVRRAVARGGIVWCVAPLATCPLVGPANLRADRYLYLASAGALLVLVSLSCVAFRAAAPTWARARRWPPALLAGIAIAGALGVVTGVGARVWRDDVALFTHAVEVAPGSAKAWAALGWAHRRNGAYEASEVALGRALLLAPERDHTRVVLGGLRLVRGDVRGAESIARELEAEMANRPAPGGLAQLRRCLDANTTRPRECLGDVRPAR